jgi:6-phosphogluconate dehydrogenase
MKTTTQLGMIGLGRMGFNMVRRLIKGGIQCVVFNRSPQKVKNLVKEKAVGASSLADLVKKLQKPRAVWLMVPAAIVEKFIADLLPLLEPGDILIDGGNSCYVDDIRRAKELAPKKIHYVDVGTSGGVWGLKRGYCMMIGGEKSVVQQLDPIFTTLAPGSGDIPRTTGRKGDITEVWRRGSVIASWLLDLTADALAKDAELAQFAGRVSDSGEGRWTIKAAIDEGVPVPVLTTALYARFASRGAADFQGKVLSAMRYGFGGHLEKPAK